jgi:hypothetical protein
MNYLVQIKELQRHPSGALEWLAFKRKFLFLGLASAPDTARRVLQV